MIRWIIIAFFLGISAAFAANAPAPPEQPASGPGGKEAAHTEVIAELHEAGAKGYWLFEPAKPAPKEAPLIIFNHGWSAMDPQIYKAWIDHIVRRGNIVVYPVYQASLRTPVRDFTSNAIAAVQDAIHTLQEKPGHVRPQLDKCAFVGHSMGGEISANLAVLWKSQNLPQPRAVMCVEPGKTSGQPVWANIPLEDLSQIPAGTLLLAIAGDSDQVVRDTDAKRIFHESKQVPLTNKDFITLVSDNHGEPALKATHMAPVAWAQMPEAGAQETNQPSSPLRERLKQRMEDRRETNGELADLNTWMSRTLDALDFYGTWKLFDGLTDAAFYGTNRNYALGNTKQQRFMGVWSDGVPVKELKVTDQP